MMNVGERLSDHIAKYLKQNSPGFTCECVNYKRSVFDLSIYSLDENRYTDECYGVLELKSSLKASLHEQYIKQARDFNDSDFGVRLPIIPEVKFNKLIGKKDSNLKIFAGNKNNSNKKKLLLLNEIR